MLCDSPLANCDVLADERRLVGRNASHPRPPPQPLPPTISREDSSRGLLATRAKSPGGGSSRIGLPGATGSARAGATAGVLLLWTVRTHMASGQYNSRFPERESSLSPVLVFGEFHEPKTYAGFRCHQRRRASERLCIHEALAGPPRGPGGMIEPQMRAYQTRMRHFIQRIGAFHAPCNSPFSCRNWTLNLH